MLYKNYFYWAEKIFFTSVISSNIYTTDRIFSHNLFDLSLSKIIYKHGEFHSEEQRENMLKKIKMLQYKINCAKTLSNIKLVPTLFVCGILTYIIKKV